jgi:hypothetical protein
MKNIFEQASLKPPKKMILTSIILLALLLPEILGVEF